MACGGGGGDKSPTTPNNNNPGTTDNVVANVAINGNQTTVAVGSTITLAAVARNAAGLALSTSTFAWTSSASNFASVGAATGVVTGVAVGNALITAAAGGKSGVRNITVTQAGTPVPPPSNVTVDMPGTTFEPATFNLAVGGTVTFVFTAIAHDVLFGGSNAPQNIPVTTNATITRQFPQAGTYSIVCSLHAGMNGTITVQ
jgi:plastocyanin